nr:amidohydrolase family protein [Sphingomonas colocasiae]
MRNLKTALALAAAMVAPPALAEPAERHVYHGLTILDPVRERAVPDSYILVEGKRIARIGRGRPNIRGATAHDMRGAFAMPGLIDTHAHLTLGPITIEKTPAPPHLAIGYDPAITRHNAAMLLSYGVTTVRDPAGDPAIARGYDADIAQGRYPGPEALHAGEVITRSPAAFKGLALRLGPDGDMTTIVARQADAGAAYIKLYEGLNAADLEQGVKAAHARKRKAIAHLGDVSWTRAAEIGVDGIVHMMPISPDLLPRSARADYLAQRRPGAYAFFEWYEAADPDSTEIALMIKTMARRKIHLDGTLIGFRQMFHGDDRALITQRLDQAHPAMRASFEIFRHDAGWTPQDRARARAVWPRVLDLTRRMYEEGVRMTIGTDLGGMAFLVPGFSMSQEMTLHREAGIPAWAVLRMATSDAADALGLGRRTGRIAPKMEADILFLNSDPRQDMRDITDVRAVLADGRLFDPAALRRAPAGRGGSEK